MKEIIISDPTLRDGNHAVSHQITKENIMRYAELADQAGVHIIEVGHGNGLGASSLQLGIASVTDDAMIRAARSKINNAKLGIHIIPGFGRIDKDLNNAINLGVDVIRVASHCTEADTTQRHIEYVVNKSKEAFGVLMMTHMVEKEKLLSEAKKMMEYGASAIILMDSAGAYLPGDVHNKVAYLVQNLKIPIGFHAHNNLGLAVANSLSAIESGATIIDGTAKGFGAGAGNAPIEILVAILKKQRINLNIDFYKLLDACEYAENNLIKEIPQVTTMSLLSGLYGVFSGFIKPVRRIANQYDVDPKDILRILGQNKVVAGQEDLIVEIASQIKKSNLSKSFN